MARSRVYTVLILYIYLSPAGLNKSDYSCRIIVGNHVICALSVEFHVQLLRYIRSRSYSLYFSVFGAGPNIHDIV